MNYRIINEIKKVLTSIDCKYIDSNRNERDFAYKRKKEISIISKETLVG